MIRSKKRSIQKKIALFVEGETEENYFKLFKQSLEKNIKITIKEVKSMHGGGYTRFLKELKVKAPAYGYLAIFIILDLDKADSINESKKFDELVKYCRNKNQEKGGIPYFLIGTNKDFEYFLCCHCENYNNQNTNSYIYRNFKYKSVSELKSDEGIYKYFNEKGKSYKIALKKMKRAIVNTCIRNDVEIKNRKGDIIIKVKDIIVDKEQLVKNHSNMYELFDFIFDKE